LGQSDDNRSPHNEAEELLGPDVRSPVGIPKDYQPSESAREPMFRVELSDFTGPLDLLLYLIRRHDIDVLDIPIKFITARYLSFLEDLRSLEVDVASEFLVMAADLTHIKSKMLLPAKEGVAIEELDDEETEDPRAELVRRLLEYQKYRDAAARLDERDVLGRDVYARVPPAQEPAQDVQPGLKSVSIFRLVEVMAAMLDKAPPQAHHISFEHYSIAERIDHVMAFGRDRSDPFELGQLLAPIQTRAELVVTFLAVLEMTKMGLAKLYMSADEEAAELPRIEVHLTGKRFEGQLADDYGSG
jgi:segregation and condensation protein A